MARRYITLSDEQINRAQHADIAEYLRQHGETVIREGKCFVWKKHDSVRIQGYKWYQNSTQKGGAAVSFLQHFFSMHFVDAVAALTGENIPSLPERKGSPASQSAKPKTNTASAQNFVLPEKADTYKHVYAYLSKTRDLDDDILSIFFENGSLYEDIRKNAVFVGFDEKKIPRSAHKKGTNTFAPPYKRCVTGSNLNYPFGYFGGGETCYVFEAAIDLMSFMCLNRNQELLKQNYIAIGGLHINPVYQVLESHVNIKQVVFCTDNDIDGKLPDGTPHNHGQEFAKKHAHNLQTMNYETKILTPSTKDWNEDLKKERMNLL
ncbi:DUF3991 and TOPRIM domain-containing protein [Scatolibacter rhodanostii]|uniref:DUF3991 and TOPRIM domain-containing protein n=1 Tax=Scatolibacter rhodanostii TaxID=2014781 RepID=UPI000C074A48|nr:DUF3991 and TOPRIM domain-containing protein [Scatolibacter rhodanostii]